MDMTMQIFALLAKANGYKEMPDSEKLEKLTEIDIGWKNLSDDKMQCNEKAILALFMIEPLLKFKMFNDAEKWINILLSDRTNDPTQVGIYKGIFFYEKGDYENAYKYFDMVYTDTKELAFAERNLKYLEFYKSYK